MERKTLIPKASDHASKILERHLGLDLILFVVVLMDIYRHPENTVKHVKQYQLVISVLLCAAICLEVHDHTQLVFLKIGDP